MKLINFFRKLGLLRSDVSCDQCRYYRERCFYCNKLSIKIQNIGTWTCKHSRKRFLKSLYEMIHNYRIKKANVFRGNLK
jgi:ribosomal protein L37AE/L43A